MPSDRLNAALCRLTRSVLQRSREGFTRWTVVSAVDDEIYGSFLTRDEALEFAKNADGSTFQWSVTEI
jgi:hypothetical protein